MMVRRAIALMVACGLTTSGLALFGALPAGAVCPGGDLTIATTGPTELIVGESIDLTAAYCPTGADWVDVTDQAVFSSTSLQDTISGAHLTVGSHGLHLVSAAYSGQTSKALRLVAYLDAPQVLEPPRLSSLTPQTDQALSVTPGQWRPVPDQVTYQWQADGQPIQGATSPTLTPTAALIGTRLAVVVTVASAAAINPSQVLTAQTEPVAVAAAAAPLAATDNPLAGLSGTVKAKVKPTLTIKVLTKKPHVGQKIKVRVAVKAKGVPKAKIKGKVRLKVSGVTKTVMFKAKHKAKRTIKIRVKKAGRVKLKVSYLGSTTITKATKAKRLRVAR